MVYRGELLCQVVGHEGSSNPAQQDCSGGHPLWDNASFCLGRNAGAHIFHETTKLPGPQQRVASTKTQRAVQLRRLCPWTGSKQTTGDSKPRATGSSNATTQLTDTGIIRPCCLPREKDIFAVIIQRSQQRAAKVHLITSSGERSFVLN